MAPEPRTALVGALSGHKASKGVPHMSSTCQHSTAVICIECDAQLFGIDPCPDPSAHHAPFRHVVHETEPQTFGGQQTAYRTFYDRSGDGCAQIPFRRFDGATRIYDCYFPWNPPVGTPLPWMPTKTMLDTDDVLFLTGMGYYAFLAKAAALPGKTEDYGRQYETTTFVRQYIFGDLVRQAPWRRRRSMRRHHCKH